MQSHLNTTPTAPKVTPDNFPKIKTDQQSLADILGEVIARLDQVSEVLSHEYLWLKPKIDQARADHLEGVSQGVLDADMNDGSYTDIDFDSKEIDKHLLNVQMAALIAKDASSAIFCGFVLGSSE